MRSIFAMALVVAACTASAQDGFVSGNELHQWCSSKNETDTAACATFIMGTMEGAIVEWGRLNPAAKDSNSGPFCLPAGVVRGQAIDVVKADLKDQPALRHLSASGLALTSVRRAFPCK